MFTKKIISLVLIVCMLFVFVGCGQDIVLKNNKGQITERYEQIGLAELDEMDPNVEYRVVWGNVVWSIITIESIIIPIILIGWYLYEPIGVKAENDPKD